MCGLKVIKRKERKKYTAHSKKVYINILKKRKKKYTAHSKKVYINKKIYSPLKKSIYYLYIHR